LILCFSLHEDELPLPREHLLQFGEVLCLEILQLEVRLVLHRPLAQIHGVIGVLGFPAVGRPKVGRLEAIEGAVILDGQDVVVDLKEVAVRGDQMRDVQCVLFRYLLLLLVLVQPLLRVAFLLGRVLYQPRDQISTSEDGWDLQ
ncbi:hypothetical protein PENTCL1PPCAC_3964, partial [Pristionchus entomophagus]